MLRALDASSSSKVSVAAQHLMDDEATALGRALTRADVELTSLDVSRNALGKGLGAVLRGAASFSKLETFDASGVSPFAMDALASALTGGFDGLRVLRLARCQAVHKSNCRPRVSLVDCAQVPAARQFNSRTLPRAAVPGRAAPRGPGPAEQFNRRRRSERSGRRIAWFRAPFFGPLGALVGDASTLDDADKEKDLVEGERRDGPLSLTSLGRVRQPAAARERAGHRARPERVAAAPPLHK